MSIWRPRSCRSSPAFVAASTLSARPGGVTVVDDYSPHPTEIAATIKAAKALDFNRVHVLFQPHRYSRVALFTDIMRDEFGSAFDEADTVTFMDVYSAGEAPGARALPARPS